MNKYTTENFIKRAREVHGDFYDYSHVECERSKDKVEIVCPKHGSFMQVAEVHLRGNGCRWCGKEKREAVMLDKFGVRSPSQSKELVEKANETKRVRYGQLRAPGSGRRRMTLDEFVQKAREVHGDAYDYSKVVMNGTNNKVDIICPRHGVFQQTPNKHLSGHGCNHPECVQERRAKLRGAKSADDSKPGGGHHGGKPAMTTGAFVQQAVALYGDKYDYSMSNVVSRKQKVLVKCNACGTVFEMSPDNHLRGQGCTNRDCLNSRRVATNRMKYGVDNPMQAEDVKQRYVSSMISTYGVENPMQVGDIKTRQDDIRKRTMVELYGVDYPMQSQAIRDKAVDAVLLKYGVDNVMKLKMFQDKMMNAKRQNGTFNTSACQDVLYCMLQSVFGTDDVDSEYSCDEYPHFCDFYVKSRNLFIELNAHPTHGGHWFDSGKDAVRLTEIREKHMPMYDQEVYVWTDLDVRKRNVARANNLNYVVFWDTQLRDATLWLASGCPDAKDWEREYSWIRPRDFVLDNTKLPLNDNSQAFSRIAKRNQLHVFYKEEIGMWRENRLRDGIPLQIWLYYNRYKYVDKAPNDLSDLEVLRGFKISGLHMGHSVFDTSLMRQAVEKYNIKSIYDPCAGWGERMLFCRAHNIKYLGVDINQELSSGYESMTRDYNITEQEVIFDDSATVCLSERYDCVFTCPPYGNQEIYSELGAENLSYCDFLAWWGRVVENSLNVNPRYFMFQSNQKWLGELSSVVESHGFKLVDKFDAQVRASHMNRGTKKEFESLVVFEKI